MARWGMPGLADPGDGGPDHNRYELRQTEDVTKLSLAERLGRLNQLCIRYPRFNAAVDLIRQAHESARTGCSPLCAFIGGPTQVGKTALYKAYMQSLQMRSTEEATEVPIFPFTVPVPATPRTVVSAMLQRLGDPNHDRGTTAGLSSRVAHFLRAGKVELVIMDQFHHLMGRGTSHDLAIISDWLRNLIMSTGVPVVAFGKVSGEGLLDYRTEPDEVEAPLGRCFPIRQRLTPFSWDQKNEADEFRIFMRLYDEAVPLAQRSRLDDPGIALRIHFATAGLAGPLMELMKRAIELVVAGGGERIELTHLRRAFEDRIHPRHRRRRNPFSEETAFTAELATMWRREEMN